MKISSDLIDFHYYTAYFKDSKIEALLIIIFLHKNEKISREKMVAMFRNLREDKLLRKVNTHHCKINNKWYSDEGMLTILKDAFKDVCCGKYEMDLEEFVSYYISLYLNKPKNYCVDWVMTEIVEPVVRNYSNNHEYYGALGYVKSFGVPLNISCESYEDYDPSGYCCEDCDGDYNVYKQYRFDAYVLEDNKREIKKQLANALHEYKKKYQCFTIPKKEIA